MKKKKQIKEQKSTKKVILGLLVTIIVLLGSAYLCIPIFKNINYGLDLQGGFEVLYEIEPLDQEKLTSDMVYNTYKAILKRVDILGVNEPEISIEDNNKIRIALAGIKNKEEAREIISSTAVLSFRDYNDNLLMTADVLGGEAKVTTDQYGHPAVSLSIKDTDKFYNVTNKVKDMNNNLIVIWLDFDENTDSFTKEKDNCGSLSTSRCLSAARVDRAFASDVIIQGNFTTEEATSLVELINSGSLPTKLNEISSRTVEATYGEAALNKTLVAGVIGVILVLLIMILMYHFSGLIAGTSLVLYTMLSFLVFYLIEGTLTLPGIAAMLLGIGMAVDASVISFERIKDQLKIGKPLKEAVEIGNKESLSSILDANITTIIVAIILFILGQSSVKGFATMLIINILLTIIVLVFISKAVIYFFAKSGVFDDKVNLFIGLSKKKIIPAKEVRIPFKKLDFVKSRKIILPVILILILGGLAYSIVTKFNFAVDFTGGTSITVNTIEDINLDGYTINKLDKTKDSTTIVINEKLTKEEIEQNCKIIKKLRFEEINKNNIKMASRLQYEIFPNSSAYSVYKSKITGKIKDLYIGYIAYMEDTPVGVTGIYEIPEYSDTVWLSWFGIKEEYRKLGYGKQILDYTIKKAKELDKKYLRLYTFEIWNKVAQTFYKRNMDIGEYYYNEKEHKDIFEGKPKIFSISLCDERVRLWNNKFINISEDEDSHEESVIMMKKDGIID